MVYHKGLLSDPQNDSDFWTVPLAGFSNPKYADSDTNNATGFDIHDCQAVVVAVEATGTPTFSATFEQTLDPSGLAGWFPVYGKWSDGSANAISQTVATRGVGFIVPCVGVRMRVRVTALTVADLRARVSKLAVTADFSSGIQPISSPAALIAGGSAAQDAVIAGNPIPIGLDARSAQKPVMSAGGDIVIGQASLDGRQVTLPYSISELSWQYAAAASGIVSSTADVVIKASAGAGIRNYLTSLQVSHDLLSGVSELVVKEGATVIFRKKLQVTAQEVENIVFPVPLRTFTATALNVALTASVTGGVYVNAQGFSAP
jgi:hypothetical protein